MNEEKYNMIIQEFDNANKFLRYQRELSRFILKFQIKRGRLPKSLKELCKLKGVPKKLLNNPRTRSLFTPKREKELLRRMTK